MRIFTTESEIPFAGHPTLGTSFVLAKYFTHQKEKEITLKLIDSKITVSLSDHENLDNCLFSMTQAQPAFLNRFTREEIANQLTIDATYIDENKAIQEISTGLPFIIIPIKNLACMDQLTLDATTFKAFLLRNKIYKSNSEKKLSTSLFFFTEEAHEEGNDFNTRMFCLEDDKLIEDSATGSANGCFLAYLLKYKHTKIDAKVEQGFQMNRKSYLYLNGERENSNYEIRIGGYTKLVSKGKWFI